MSRIVIFLENSENRRLLADWLSLHHEVEAGDSIVQAKQALPLFDEPFDLCILDGLALNHLWEWVQARKQSEQPVFLPFLLTTPRSDVKLLTRHLWQSVDDVISKPMERLELQARVEILLRSRQLSLELKLTNQQLQTEIANRDRAEADRAQLLLSEQAARAEAEAANLSKDEFIATLSHELRNPLNTMLGWSRLLLSRQQDQSTIQRALETIERSAQMQSQLIEDLMDVTRITQGKIRLEFSIVEPTAVIEAAIDGAQPAAAAKKIRLESTLESCSTAIYADPIRLQQIIWNLLSNAIKFTPEGGLIDVRSKCSQTHAEIQVIDTGKGIEPEFLPYIFDRFRQAEGATNKTQTGLGLGLAIVHHLVELHGGSITADSAGKGQGATFTLILPLSSTSNSAALMDEKASL